MSLYVLLPYHYVVLSYHCYFLLTEREIWREKYRTEVFFVQTEPAGRGLYKKNDVQYFSVHTKKARLIKRLLYGIYTWNKP
jgi:hypothetical protein